MRRKALASLAVGLVASGLIAQVTHVVGTTGFAEINDALAIAAPGDVILVQPGNYGNVLATFGVTIRALGAGVSVQNLVMSLSSADTMHVVGLDTWSISIDGGRVTLDNCSAFVKSLVSSSDVRLQSCSLHAVGLFFPAHPGLRATNATLTAIDSVFRGSTASAEGGAAAYEGVLLQSSTLRGSNLLVTGGSGYPGFPPSLAPKAALRAVASVVQVSDSTFAGGTGLLGGAPACAVDAQTGRLVRCTLSPACTPAIATTGPLLGLHRPGPLQSPGPFTLEFNTEPNGLVAVYFATGLGNLTIAGLEQPILLDVTSTFHLETMFADATGFASGAWNLPPGLTNAAFWFQAVGTAPAPHLLQLSPIAGGVVH